MNSNIIFALLGIFFNADPLIFSYEVLSVTLTKKIFLKFYYGIEMQALVLNLKRNSHEVWVSRIIYSSAILSKTKQLNCKCLIGSGIV